MLSEGTDPNLLYDLEPRLRIFTSTDDRDRSVRGTLA